MRRTIGVAAVLVAAWWLWPRGEGVVVDGVVDHGASSAVGPVGAPAARPSEPPGKSPRVRLPRREVARVAAAEDEVGLEVSDEVLAANPNALTMLKVLGTASGCVDQWRAVDPALSDDLVMRMEIDGKGLRDAWIEGAETVPEGVLECLTEAVWSEVFVGSPNGLAEIVWPVRPVTTISEG